MIDAMSGGQGRRARLPTEDLDQLLDLARFVERHSEPGLLVGLDVEQVPLPGRSRPLQAPTNPR